MKKEQGFTLIEMIIVVTVIGLIAAIAVPNLRRARQTANAASAVSSLRTISTAEMLYSRKTLNNTYGTLLDLVPEGTIDIGIGLGAKSGYLFTMTLTPEGTVANKHYSCKADPVEDPTILEHFFIDDTGVIRVELGAVATVASDPLQR